MKKLLEYFNDVMAELKKVVWPTREVLLTSTVVVVIISLMFSIYIMGVDRLLNQIVGLILKN